MDYIENIEKNDLKGINGVVLSIIVHFLLLSPEWRLTGNPFVEPYNIHFTSQVRQKTCFSSSPDIVLRL